MRLGAVVVASGRGTRFGGDLPKQWRRLAGNSLVGHALAALRGTPGLESTIVVHHPDDAAEAELLRRPGVELIAGGVTRGDSVRAGLEALAADPPEAVLIHDAARPCVSAALIGRVVAALEDHEAAAPALPVTDALWRGHDTVVAAEPRAGLWRAQTPQGFRFDTILKAHREFWGDPADDVEVARAVNVVVAIVPGEEDNLKVTHPGDLARAARILEGRMDVRTGQGFDVHAFGPGDHVTLCGVRIPFDRGLVGHSDADAGLHALTDAVLGALALGDIGTHFPPSDPQWRGANSRLFLRRAGSLAAEAGFRVNHCDVTLVCEAPKVGPHAAAMRAAIAETLSLDVARVSVKATTSEGLGFTGRGEGIAALATATLVRG